MKPGAETEVMCPQAKGTRGCWSCQKLGERQASPVFGHLLQHCRKLLSKAPQALSLGSPPPREEKGLQRGCCPSRPWGSDALQTPGPGHLSGTYTQEQRLPRHPGTVPI